MQSSTTHSPALTIHRPTTPGVKRRALCLIHHPHGPRLYVAGVRVHHGLAGLIGAALCALTGAHKLAATLALYGASDWRDFPFRDTDNH